MKEAKLLGKSLIHCRFFIYKVGKSFVFIVKNIAAKISNATINSIFTPCIVIDENIIPETLSAIGDKILSIA